MDSNIPPAARRRPGGYLQAANLRKVGYSVYGSVPHQIGCLPEYLDRLRPVDGVAPVEYAALDASGDERRMESYKSSFYGWLRATVGALLSRVVENGETRADFDVDCITDFLLAALNVNLHLLPASRARDGPGRIVRALRLCLVYISREAFGVPPYNLRDGEWEVHVGRQPVEPGPGQESVWDYPRPPRLEDINKKVEVVFGGVTLACTTQAKRVLETSHPPVYYIPPEDIRMEHLEPSVGGSYYEWKGRAGYYDVALEGRTEPRAAWFYPDPTPPFAGLKDYVAFYPSKMDGCWVGGEKVEAQEGDFYGGWITSDIEGPFKGGPGTWGW
jgi:uncharacterized protein (DUF427 family)